MQKNTQRPAPVKVFICYAREDQEIARRLYADLKNAGVGPWMDCEDLSPGQKWRMAINQVLKDSSFVIALLSSRSLSKQGFVQKELKKALDLLDHVPDSEIFLIPVRLEDCEPQDEKLQELHWVDLLPDYELGLQRILRVLIPEERDKPVNPPVSFSTPETSTPTSDVQPKDPTTTSQSQEPPQTRGRQVEEPNRPPKKSFKPAWFKWMVMAVGATGLLIVVGMMFFPPAWWKTIVITPTPAPTAPTPTPDNGNIVKAPTPVKVTTATPTATSLIRSKLTIGLYNECISRKCADAEIPVRICENLQSKNTELVNNIYPLMFRLTDQFFEDIRNYSVPEEIIKNFQNLAKQQGQENNVVQVELEDLFSEQQTLRYKELIIKHALPFIEGPFASDLAKVLGENPDQNVKQEILDCAIDKVVITYYFDKSGFNVGDIPKFLEQSKDLEQWTKIYNAPEGQRLFHIDGHTDCCGTDAYNLNLSKERADTVYNMLKFEFGIKWKDKQNLIVRWCGKRRLAKKGVNVETTRENQRVEFYVTPERFHETYEQFLNNRSWWEEDCQAITKDGPIGEPGRELPKRLQEGLVAYYPFNDAVTDQNLWTRCREELANLAEQALYRCDRCGQPSSVSVVQSAADVRELAYNLRPPEGSPTWTIAVWLKADEGFGELNQAWHFLAAIVDPAQNIRRLYLDGKEAVDQTFKARLRLPVTLGKKAFVIGSDQTGKPYRGSIDDLRIYNRELSQEDVQALYYE